MLPPSQQGRQAAQDTKDEVICSATTGRTCVLLPPYVRLKLNWPTRTWLSVQKAISTLISQQKYSHKNWGQLFRSLCFMWSSTERSPWQWSAGELSGAQSAVGSPCQGDLGSSDRGSQAKATCDAQGPPYGCKNKDVATLILYK